MSVGIVKSLGERILAKSEMLVIDLSLVGCCELVPATPGRFSVCKIDEKDFGVDDKASDVSRRYPQTLSMT